DACGQALEMPNDAKQLLPIIHSKRGDDEASLTGSADGADESFRLEAVQRAGDGGAAEGGAGGHDAFGDAGAGGQLPPDDHAAEIEVGARALVAPLRAGLGRAMRPRRRLGSR